MALLVALAALAVAPLGAAGLTLDQALGVDYVCRAQRPDGSWESCGGGSAQAAATGRLSAPTADEPRPPLELLPQAELDVATTGYWEDVAGSLPADSLGSLSRYATCSLYLGPKSDLGKLEGTPIPEDVMKTPHAKRFAGWANRSKCHEYRFISNASAVTSFHPYSWATRESAQRCVQGRWIAFWGDSTTRLAFSSMVDFLAGGIETPSFPTHDWSYDLHSDTIDKCKERAEEGDKQELACHLAAHIPESRTTVTFNWVTSMRLWPSLKRTLAAFRDREQFPNLQLNAAPDLLLINSGPWEVYELSGWTGWIGNDRYTEVFDNWLEHEFGELVDQGQRGVGQVGTKLMMLGNTACPKGKKLLCKVHGTPCTEKMWDLAELQRSLLKRKAAELGMEDSVRWVDARNLYDPLPNKYRCKGSGFHLPAVVTDARVNHVLHAACSR